MFDEMFSDYFSEAARDYLHNLMNPTEPPRDTGRFMRWQYHIVAAKELWLMNMPAQHSTYLWLSTDGGSRALAMRVKDKYASDAQGP